MTHYKATLYAQASFDSDTFLPDAPLSPVAINGGASAPDATEPTLGNAATMLYSRNLEF